MNWSKTDRQTQTDKPSRDRQTDIDPLIITAAECRADGHYKGRQNPADEVSVFCRTDHIPTTFTNHIPTTYRPHTNHIPTTFTDHMPITYRPNTYRPHANHVPTTYRPHIDHTPTTCRPRTDHLYQPHTNHIPTTYQSQTNHNTGQIPTTFTDHIPTDQLVHLTQMNYERLTSRRFFTARSTSRHAIGFTDQVPTTYRLGMPTKLLTVIVQYSLTSDNWASCCHLRHSSLNCGIPSRWKNVSALFGSPVSSER